MVEQLMDDMPNRQAVEKVIDILTVRISREKNMIVGLEEDGARPDVVKSLRAKIRRMGSARRILKDYRGCWEYLSN